MVIAVKQRDVARRQVFVARRKAGQARPQARRVPRSSIGRVRGALVAVAADLRAAVFHSVVNVMVGSALVPSHVRRECYRVLGFDVGKATLAPHLTFKSNKISIGDQVYINERCSFDNVDWVRIGDRVHVGPEVLLGTSSHEIGSWAARAGPVSLAPLVIAPGCWIGARAVLLPGVTIGEGCIVGAGAVVTNDCIPHGLYAGVPARRLRDLPV